MCVVRLFECALERFWLLPLYAGDFRAAVLEVTFLSGSCLDEECCRTLLFLVVLLVARAALSRCALDFSAGVDFRCCSLCGFPLCADCALAASVPIVIAISIIVVLTVAFMTRGF